MRGQRAGRRERLRSRRRRACARQSHRRVQSRRAALRSRRARSRDEGVRPLHRRLQRIGGRESHAATISSRWRRRSNTSARRTRSCSRMRSRHSTARCRSIRSNADAQDQARRAVSAQVQLRRRAEHVRGRSSDEPEQSARAAWRGDAVAGRRPGRRRLIAPRGAEHQSRLRRSADAARGGAARPRGLHRGAARHRSRAEGESDVGARAGGCGGDQVSDARSGRVRGDAAACARAEPERCRSLRHPR